MLGASFQCFLSIEIVTAAILSCFPFAYRLIYFLILFPYWFHHVTVYDSFFFKCLVTFFFFQLCPGRGATFSAGNVLFYQWYCIIMLLYYFFFICIWPQIAILSWIAQVCQVSPYLHSFNTLNYRITQRKVSTIEVNMIYKNNMLHEH